MCEGKMAQNLIMDYSSIQDLEAGSHYIGLKNEEIASFSNIYKYRKITCNCKLYGKSQCAK